MQLMTTSYNDDHVSNVGRDLTEGSLFICLDGLSINSFFSETSFFIAANSIIGRGQ